MQMKEIFEKRGKKKRKMDKERPGISCWCQASALHLLSFFEVQTALRKLLLQKDSGIFIIEHLGIDASARSGLFFYSRRNH